MIKGCQKRIIFVKDTGSDYFEEAYFIMKSDKDLPFAEETDIVKEAENIVNSSMGSPAESGKKKIGARTVCFCIGALIGAVISGILFGLIF
ncbi:MAG: hypothetical protein ACI3XX_05485 [Eubacteriales bacterium]